MFRRAVPADEVLKVAKRTGHHQQFTHRKDTALDGAGGQLTDALYSTEAGRAVLDEQ